MIWSSIEFIFKTETLIRITSYNVCYTKLLRPYVIMMTRSMDELYLDGNQISEFPSLLGNWSYLDKLDLSNNKLTSLPGNIYELQRLRYLNLSNNRLMELPKEISLMDKLDVLDLRNNPLPIVITSYSIHYTKLYEN